MKNLAFAAIFTFLISFQASAQFNEAGSRSLTFGINGFSTIGINPVVGHNNTLLFRYFPTEDIGYRFLANLGISNSSSTNDNGVDTKNTNSTIRNSFGAGIGAQKTIAKFGKFNAYTGADIIASNNYSKSSTKNEYYKTSTRFQEGDYLENISIQPSPLNIGIYPLIGINYFFSKNFSIGFEYSLSATYSFPASGKNITNQRYFGVDKPQVSTNTGSLNSFSLSTNNNSIITMSLYF